MLLSLLLLVPAAYAQLNTLAKAKGLTYFGSATDNPELTDAQYVKILSDNTQFGQITPGNSQKWDALEPSQNTFSYTRGDAIASLAKANGQLLRCHTLVWHSQLPSWVSSGTWTNATLIAAMKNHIQNVVTHYKGQCLHWDVVNEAFNDDGTYRDSVFSRIIGPEFIPIAFQTAALYDPTVKLYYNDYNTEYAGAKATAVINLVKSLQARGIKIDGVGIQGHMIVGNAPSLSAQISNLNSFTALGVEVAYTELDIRHPSLPPTAAQYATQAASYANTVNACVSVKGCVGVTIWDYTDKYSWIPSVFAGQGEALPWNADFSVKSAYGAMVSVLGGSVSSTSTTATATATATPTATTLVTSTKTSTSAATTTTASAGTIPKWGECGKGTATCVTGTTCTFQNPWYSQCL